MASGYFPLSRTIGDYGPSLVKIANDLRAPQAGSIMNAESVGGQIVALSKMLRACANQEEESKKLKWIVGITRIDTSEDGQITFDLVLLPKNPAPAQTEMAV